MINVVGIKHEIKNPLLGRTIYNTNAIVTIQMILAILLGNEVYIFKINMISKLSIMFILSKNEK